MAATIARAWGHDKSRVKEVHRLGSEYSVVEAATWNTFAMVRVDRDGAGWVEVKQNGKSIHSFTWGPESYA